MHTRYVTSDNRVITEPQEPSGEAKKAFSAILNTCDVLEVKTDGNIIEIRVGKPSGKLTNEFAARGAEGYRTMGADQLEVELLTAEPEQPQTVTRYGVSGTSPQTLG